MKWYSDLFIGSKAEPNKEEIISRAERGDFVRGLYLITLASNGIDQLDLVRAGSIAGKAAAISHMPPIVGIAIGKREAIEVAAEIVRCAFAEEHSADIRSWLQSREGQV